MSSERIESVAVLGAGTMGSGIAQNAAQAGLFVRLADADIDRAEAGRDGIDAVLRRLEAKGKLTGAQVDGILERIEAVATREEAVGAADIVVEAAPEDMALKRRMFTALAREAPPHAVLGTNTSSLPIGRIAEGCGAEERVIGLHFFNPVHIMKLLEIVVGEQTSDEVTARMRAFAERIGKQPPSRSPS